MNMKLKIITTAVLLTTTSLSLLSNALAPLQANAENLQQIQKLLSSKQCQQCDLSNAGLVYADLAGAQLSGADLSRANLSRANLAGTDLSGANLSGASLAGANLTGANLSGANLTGTDLRDAYLVNAKLFGTNLNTAFVQGAIGIPQYAGTVEDFYAWGIVESDRGNYRAAIENYNKALSLKPDFAAALLGRGVARYNLGDVAGATQDAQSATVLFTVQENMAGSQVSQNVVQGIQIAIDPPKARSRTSIGDTLVSLASLLFSLIP